ncbi:MAG: PEP/pyruvate-binding domain-containing protein [Bacillota bacterium]
MKGIITMENVKEYRDVNIVGGKGSNLFKLKECGCNVPPFIVLPTSHYNEYTDLLGEKYENALQNIDTSTPESIALTSKAIRELFSPEYMSKEFDDHIMEEINDKIGCGCYLAVRSSATSEDSEESSYAGQLDSFLFVKTKEEVMDAVAKCWASGFSERAVAYRKAKGIPQEDFKVAVIIQEMIDGKISGVTFTVNPITQRIDEMLLCATYGLGEGLVSGKLNSDQFVCYKDNPVKIANSQIAAKQQEVVFDNDTNKGTKTVSVDEQLKDGPCLKDSMVIDISNVCRKIELSFGNKPQDIEWTVDENGKIYILQTRPVTTLEKLKPSLREYKTIWDNSNIVESYSGITLPLTFSFALNAYHMVYTQFCEVLKVPRKKIIKNDFYLSNMLGLLNGRVYYNIKNWCRLISVLPGYNYDRKFMEQMMGVKEKIDFNPDEEGTKSSFKKYFIELPQLLWSGANLVWQFATIKSKIKKFMYIYRKQYDKYKHYDFNKKSSFELLNIYNELENTVLRNWKAPIINDFMAMIFFGMLRLLIEKWKLDDDGSLHNDLVSGQGNVESTMPLKKLMEIADHIRKDTELAGIFKSCSEEQLVDKFIHGRFEDLRESGKSLHKMLESYLDEFGFRTMNELKLEEPTLMEKPQFIFSILKNYTRLEQFDLPDTSGKNENKIRKKAEKEVAARFKRQGLPGLVRKPIFKLVVSYTKRAVAFREYQRFARTRMFGLARLIFLGIAHRFAELGVIDEVDDIFYLTKDEIFSFIAGTSVSAGLKDIVTMRRNEYGKYRQVGEMPDRIETFGPVYCNDLTAAAMSEEASPDSSPDMLKGVCCCPGVVKGKVKVIQSPGDDMCLNGEILVAYTTDPGWIPLYPSAAGLLVEYGSILSHSAIVARELGLPAIVGIKGITKKLKTGDMVEMDGAKGTVRIL